MRGGRGAPFWPWPLPKLALLPLLWLLFQRTRPQGECWRELVSRVLTLLSPRRRQCSRISHAFAERKAEVQAPLGSPGAGTRRHWGMGGSKVEPEPRGGVGELSGWLTGCGEHRERGGLHGTWGGFLLLISLSPPPCNCQKSKFWGAQAEVGDSTPFPETL